MQMTSGAHNDMIQRWKRRRAYTEAGLKVLEKTTVSVKTPTVVMHYYSSTPLQDWTKGGLAGVIFAKVRSSSPDTSL